MTRRLERFFPGEEGATMVEYALMVALIGATLMGTVQTFSAGLGCVFTWVATTIGGP